MSTTEKRKVQEVRPGDVARSRKAKFRTVATVEAGSTYTVTFTDGVVMVCGSATKFDVEVAS